MTFTITPTDLPEVLRIDPVVRGDNRGWFTETYKLSEFARHGISVNFVQDNHSRSEHRGVLRGLHYQLPPAAQAKLVRCTAGRMFDVAVDVRPESSTFGKWAGEELTAENHRMLWIPEGFAHGFCTLTDGTEVQYKVTAEYHPERERVIRWNDPALGIQWPIDDPTLSPRDAAAPTLKEVNSGS